MRCGRLLTLFPTRSESDLEVEYIQCFLEFSSGNSSHDREATLDWLIKTNSHSCLCFTLQVSCSERTRLA